jgi:hypothetical protein
MAAYGALPPPAGRAETLLERPVFGIERPLSNAWGIRGSCGREVPIERRRGHAEAVRDLGHADVGIGEHRTSDASASLAWPGPTQKFGPGAGKVGGARTRRAVVPTPKA